MSRLQQFINVGMISTLGMFLSNSPALAYSVNPATQLAFENPEYSVAVGGCGAFGLFIHRLDDAGEEVYGTTSATVSMSGDGVTFYTDWQCTQEVTSGVIDAAQSQVNFYFKPSVPGSIMIIAESNGLTTATQIESVEGSATPSPSPSPSPTVKPSPSPSPSPTVKPSPSPSPSPTVKPSPSPSPTVSRRRARHHHLRRQRLLAHATRLGRLRVFLTVPMRQTRLGISLCRLALRSIPTHRR